ncbi:MAG: DNA polymerase III subunit delta' [Aestuariivirga sp.]|uniref:DNA polymerase III subunit delta' n=1 Tax=Aestuariivirga sp. TaxID=2650926 RepID=UPI0038CF6343
MAEEFRDPREVDWHPRRAQTLVGHEAAEARLLQACQSEKLHHAWLITGAEGIGKATLAYRFAKFLLQAPTAAEAKAHGGLHVSPESHVFRQVAAGAHPDLLAVQRGVDYRNKRLKTELAVEDARAAPEFFSRTAAGGGWRIAVVDSADELNAASANALLKVIEEPPRRSLFLIVCNNLGRLLPTLRSRCLTLPLSPLSDAQTLAVLRSLPEKALEGKQDSLTEAVALSKGSPGKALRLAGSLGAQAFAAFQKRARLSPAVAVEIGAAFSGRETAEDFHMFCDLLVGWTGEQARAAGLSGQGAALAAAHDDINSSLRQADALNLDRRQTVTDALMRLEEAFRAS